MKVSDSQILKHHMFRFKYTELNEIYFTMSLRSFAASLVAVFAPIYLYNLGYSLKAIFVYYTLMYLFEAVFEIVSALGIRKIGAKKLIAISLPLLIVHFGLFMTLAKYHWPLWLIALEGGFLLALFWEAYHYDFSMAKHRKKSTSEVSQLYIILAVLGAAAPFIGGIIAASLGMPFLFGLVMLLLFVAMIPLLTPGKVKLESGKFNLKKINLKSVSRDLISYVGDGWEGSIGAVAWPLFIFLIVRNYQTVGFVTSFALILTVVVTYIVGKRADKGKGQRQKYVKYGGYLDGTIYFLQTLAATATHVLFFNIARGFSSSVFTSPYVAEYYLHADEKSRSEYIFMMESIIDIGRIFLFGILALSTLFLPIKSVLIFGLILGGIGAFMVTLMPPAKCEICQPIENKEIKVARKPAPRQQEA